MGYEDDIPKEKLTQSKPTKHSGKMTLREAVKLGEYNPEFLSTFPEWIDMSPHVQLQFIKEGMDNRRKQLLMQWAEMDRAIDARLKTNLHEAQKNIEKQLRKIQDDRERLYYEYSKKF